MNLNVQIVINSSNRFNVLCLLKLTYFFKSERLNIKIKDIKKAPYLAKKSVAKNDIEIKRTWT